MVKKLTINESNEKIYDLPCYDNRKSFYGKAKVKEVDGEKILQSYNTDVAKIDKDGKFVKLWDGNSQTTDRHIKSFKQHFDITENAKRRMKENIGTKLNINKSELNIWYQMKLDEIKKDNDGSVYWYNISDVLAIMLAYDEDDICCISVRVKDNNMFNYDWLYLESWEADGLRADIDYAISIINDVEPIINLVEEIDQIKYINDMYDNSSISRDRYIADTILDIYQNGTSEVIAELKEMHKTDPYYDINAEYDSIDNYDEYADYNDDLDDLIEQAKSL